MTSKDKRKLSDIMETGTTSTSQKNNLRPNKTVENANYEDIL